MKVIIPATVILLAHLYARKSFNPLGSGQPHKMYVKKMFKSLSIFVRSLAKGGSVSKHKHPAHFSISAVT